jgi:pyruvate/2-oxoglutarate dehydrogenase complex dihydrolipoamide acyltransferase (E2) component
MSATAGQLVVTVPDIGDFGEVPVIEILVSVGDTVAVEDPLVTLESDKATMDVPSPAAGVVKALHVKVGDSVSEGSLVLDLETTDGGSAPEPPGNQRSPASTPAAVQDRPLLQQPPLPQHHRPPPFKTLGAWEVLSRPTVAATATVPFTRARR